MKNTDDLNKNRLQDQNSRLIAKNKTRLSIEKIEGINGKSKQVWQNKSNSDATLCKYAICPTSGYHHMHTPQLAGWQWLLVLRPVVRASIRCVQLVSIFVERHESYFSIEGSTFHGEHLTPNTIGALITESLTISSLNH